VWTPPQNGESFPRILGHPAFIVEGLPAIGTQGDVNFVDLSQYAYADRGDMNFVSSLHVQFLTDQEVLRVTYRADGSPLWNTPLTPYNGGSTLSAFVSLAAR
jgi:HK97 family phage major capsid protein